METNIKELIPSCSLSNSEMIERKTFLTNGLAKKISEINELKDGYDLIFKESDDFSNELLDFINFERKCCSNFTYALIFEPNNKATHLQIYGSKSIKNELKQGFGELGLINSKTNNKGNYMHNKLGWLGIGLCGLCCLFPIIGAFVGIGALAGLAFYVEKLGLFVLVLALIFFVYDYWKKRKSGKSCGTSSDINCGCKAENN
jgi:hypothetical protein